MGSMITMGAPTAKNTAIAIPSERPRAETKPVLVVIAGPELGRRIDLGGGEVDIGRDEGVTLRIDSDNVSRKHATIRRFAGGTFGIADLHSTNGTFVNDKRIKNHILIDGDQIRIGKVVLKYTECAIEAQYHEQIVQRATVDALTGAFNKGFFQETLKKLCSSSRSSTLPLSLVVFDIDHFKNINDTWGHAAGDVVLRRVADVVRAQLRPRDTFCRVGGEEFALVLEGTPLGAARAAAELIRGSVEMNDFVHEGKKIPVTISLGAVELSPTDASAEALFQRADARLYEAKRSGRNRVAG